MRLLSPIIMIIIAVGLFFGFIDPHYKGIQEDKKLEAQYDEALSRSKELKDIREDLLREYNAFEEEDKKRLEKLLPDNIDNVRLIMEIDGIAKNYGLSVKNLSVGESSDSSQSQKSVDLEQIGPDGKEYASMTLEFAVGAKYETFLAFLTDLEKSLRLVDVVSIDFTSTESDFNDYRVTIKTYWLK